MRELTSAFPRSGSRSAPIRPTTDPLTESVRVRCSVRPPLRALVDILASFKVFLRVRAWSRGRSAASHAFWESDVTAGAPSYVLYVRGRGTPVLAALSGSTLHTFLSLYSDYIAARVSIKSYTLFFYFYQVKSS